MSKLLTERDYYKPFDYPWAFEFYKKQQQMHWLPDEVPLQDDIKDYNQKLTDDERTLIDNILSSLHKQMLMCVVDMQSIIYQHLNNQK